MREVLFHPTFSAWQSVARAELLAGHAPEDLIWQELDADQPSLGFEAAESPRAPKNSTVKVPRAFLALAQSVACHRAPARWALLYRTLWRLTHGEAHLLEVAVDPGIHELLRMDKSVRRDIHKMRAFLRFRAVERPGGPPWYVAWFEPEHRIVERNAAFFVDRFAGMRWSILTPDRCAHWDGERLTFTAGVSHREAPTNDNAENLWRTYYANIFNPARVKTHAMQAEMPKKYWRNLPEAEIIADLLADAPRRTEAMITRSRNKTAASGQWHPAEPPPDADLASLRHAAETCTACPLYKNATQTVFGEGSPRAPLVFIGEQPGDAEDRAGRPFIGPAGQLFDRALAEAGVDRDRTYVTNAVKHFKWEPRGKRRLHRTPGARDVASCRPWLEAELALIQPRVIVCLGGTAAHALFGPAVRVLRDRGKIMPSDFCARTLVTVHPSALLRAASETERAEGYARFVEDLRAAGALLEQ